VRNVAENATTIPIGRPIANTEIYVLDPQLNPVPVGVAGELYVGGDGLARGYLNCPELTAERFIANPFSSDSTSRLYKTGDLARYLQDGNIEFLRRTDHQVKIRGYRIELGEIETALAQHPSLRETVVVAREDATGDRRLIAYIVPDQSGHPSDHALRSFLKQRLPEYMLPSHFVSLNYLPLTPVGKIDRSALPPPTPMTAHRQSIYVEPRTPTEEVLAAIWGEVLNTTRISVHDDFFELGGHSLLAIRLLAQLREECQLELSVRSLFEAPTIAELAAKIETVRREDVARARDKKPWSYLIEIQRGVINEPVFIVPGGVGGEPDLLKHFRLARCVGREFSFYGLVARGSDGLSPPHATVEEMAVDYLKEIRSLQPAGPYYLVGECIGGIVAYEVAYQLRKQNQEVALLAMMDTFRPTMAKYLRYRCGQAVRPISTWWRGYYYAVAHNYYVRRFAFHLDQLMRILGRKKRLTLSIRLRRVSPSCQTFFLKRAML
jgi:acyl carrier protein